MTDFPYDPLFARAYLPLLESASWCVMRHRNPPASVGSTRATFPAKSLECCRDAPLVGSPYLGKFNVQPISRDLHNGRALLTQKKARDWLLPSVNLVSRLLLRHDELTFESSLRPPAAACPVEMHGLCEKLIAVTDKGFDIDAADLDGPEAPPASFITEIRRFVGGADENASAWFDHLLASVAGAIALGVAGDEGFEGGGLSLVEGGHFGDLDKPFAVQVLRNVFAAGA